VQHLSTDVPIGDGFGPVTQVRANRHDIGVVVRLVEGAQHLRQSLPQLRHVALAEPLALHHPGGPRQGHL